MVRMNFQCRGVLLVRKVEEQGPTAVLAVGAGKNCLDIILLSLLYLCSFSVSLTDCSIKTEYCLERTINQSQPTRHCLCVSQGVGSCCFYFDN